MAVPVAATYAVFSVANRGLAAPAVVPAFGVDIALITIRYFVVFTFVWVYARSLLGLRDVCQKPLRLTAYYLDHLMGMRAFGSLSLSLAASFFVGLALGTLWLNLTAKDVVLAAPPFFYATGLVLFLLPLRSVHQQMAEKKRRELLFLQRRYAGTFWASEDQPGPVRGRATTRDLLNMLDYSTVEPHVSALCTWPFDWSKSTTR